MVLPDSTLREHIKTLKLSLHEDLYLKHHPGIVDDFIRNYETHDCSETALDFMSYSLSIWAEMTAQKEELGMLELRECPALVLEETVDSTEDDPEFQMFVKIVKDGETYVVLAADAREDKQDALTEWTEKVLRLGYEFIEALGVHSVAEDGIDEAWVEWLKELE
jgi:hypothetical protein